MYLEGFTQLLEKWSWKKVIIGNEPAIPISFTNVAKTKSWPGSNLQECVEVRFMDVGDVGVQRWSGGTYVEQFMCLPYWWRPESNDWEGCLVMDNWCIDLAIYIICSLFELNTPKKTPIRGIEPRSARWERTVIAITLYRTLLKVNFLWFLRAMIFFIFAQKLWYSSQYTIV